MRGVSNHLHHVFDHQIIFFFEKKKVFIFLISKKENFVGSLNFHRIVIRKHTYVHLTYALKIMKYVSWISFNKHQFL